MHARWRVEDDLDAARDAVRPWLAFYLGAMGAKEKNFYVELAERAGHGAAARECQEAFLGGDRERRRRRADRRADRRDGASPRRPTRLDERLAAFEAVGVDTLVAVPCGDRDRAGRCVRGAGAPPPTAG